MLQSLAHPWLSLCVLSLMAQAVAEHGFAFELLTLFQDLLCAPAINISGRQYPEAVTLVLVAVV